MPEARRPAPCFSRPRRFALPPPLVRPIVAPDAPWRAQWEAAVPLGSTPGARYLAGRGIPLVVVHGFSAEGFLYAQTLSRLV